MSLKFASLLLPLAFSPAACLPRQNYHNDAHTAHITRSEPLKMPGWEIGVVIICLLGGMMLIGLLGGACETLVCMRFKRPLPTGPPPRDSDDLDFGCQGRPDGMPEIKVIREEKVADEGVHIHHEEIGLGRSGSGRYSWQDGQGVMTEVYLDGSLPDAGPEEKVKLGVVNTEAQGYPVQAAMRGYEGVHYQGPPTGLASNPPFVIHDEYDDSDYESDPPRQSEDSVDFHGPAVAMSTNDVVSPLTPEPLRMAWPQQTSAADETAHHFSNVDLHSERLSPRP